MAPELPPEQHASYSAIIDAILSTADLDTVSAKAIRKGLQEKVDYDLASQKQAITTLIMERFDKFQRDRDTGPTNGAIEPAPTTNGANHEEDSEEVAESVEKVAKVKKVKTESKPPSAKRKASDDDDDDDDDSLSDVKDTPPPKKAKRGPKPETETDEQIARRLQAEYSAVGARSTRGGGASATKKKKSTTKPTTKKPNKKKSAAKINSDMDSDVEGRSSSSPKPPKEKKGGFHKPLNLSQPLQELLGETQLSRPETVKRIWAYVKERDLQDPDDRRQIRCDDLMRGVFKSEKVHMFTMNKVLATQLYPVEQ